MIENVIDVLKNIVSVEGFSFVIIIALGVALGIHIKTVIDYIIKGVSFVVETIGKLIYSLRLMFGKKGRSICAGCGEQLRHCECTDASHKSVRSMFKQSNRNESTAAKAMRLESKRIKKETKARESEQKVKVKENKEVIKEMSKETKAIKKEAKKAPAPAAKPAGRRRS